MDGLESLKDIINENLSHIVVTNDMKRELISNISPNNNNFWLFFKHNWMRLTTAFTMLLLICTLGINSLLPVHKPKIIEPKSNPYMSLMINKNLKEDIKDEKIIDNEESQENEEEK
ncbi:MAG TPA: hypothetical protein VIK84_01740 [Haloplasmataceae bacterium]